VHCVGQEPAVDLHDGSQEEAEYFGLQEATVDLHDDRQKYGCSMVDTS
jgi:hypothetical protein